MQKITTIGKLKKIVGPKVFKHGTTQFEIVGQYPGGAIVKMLSGKEVNPGDLQIADDVEVFIESPRNI